MNTVMHCRATWIEDRVRDWCFGGGAIPSGAPLTFGAELELLAVHARHHTPMPIFGDVGTLHLVRAVARRLSWRETLSPKGVPRFLSVTGGSLTFEPGGQLEYASAVHRSVHGVLAELCRVETALRDAARECGVSLLACGVDPFNGPEDAGLQLDADRYQRMATHFASIGPAGARMMRQTASLQLNVGGIPAAERFAVANAIAPWLVALFANSPRYAGHDTDCASYRSETWREVDSSRTGVMEGDDAVREYAAFAGNATAFLADPGAPPFATLDDRLVNDASLATHLSTLFPEVRPRGYLEVRCIDALDGASRAAAMAVVAGILADPVAAAEASALVGVPDADLLRRAAREGLREQRIATTVDDLVAIALDGCARLGIEIVSEAVLSEVCV